MRKSLFTSTVLASVTLAIPALAADAAKAPKSVPAWTDGIAFSGVVDAGGTYNPSNPRDNKNFGRLTDDETGVQLNQILLTAQRPIDSTLKDYDFGFKLQGLYGSDARISRTIGLLEKTAGHNINQLDITEANVLVHTPWFTDGGFDLKIGKYSSPESAETVDASNNFFYSHSYIFNFGDPFYHTGVSATLHVSPMLDLYAGIDTGVNTTLGSNGDNNDSLGFSAGVGLNLMGGNLTSLLSTHIGPEIADAAITNGLLPATVNADHTTRALSTLTTVWKLDDKWTLTNDLNWIYDSDIAAGDAANAFGIAQYATYKINDMFSVGLRGELYRDINGSFVAQFVDNYDFTRAQQGLPLLSSRSVGGGKTTYGMLTAGVNITPDLGVKCLKGIRFRPEVRYDNSFLTRPFNDGTDKDQITFGVDMVLTF
jgi:hypothetical protein